MSYYIAALAEIMLQQCEDLLRLRDAYARSGFSYHEAPFCTAAGNVFNRSNATMSGVSVSTRQAGRCFWGPVDVRLFAVSRKVFIEAVKIFDEANDSSSDTNHSSIYKDIPLIILQSTVS